MKRLAVFCDGTWNRADQTHDDAPCPTNVVKLAIRVAKRDGGIPQLTCYDQGVGSGNVLDKWSGGAFGSGLEDNIYDAYRFLVLNYEPGDELYFFGFSRGAYTARSLAGMVRKCGILDRTRAHSYRDAIALYMDEHHPNHEVAKRFRERCCVMRGDRIPIRMIGVWDTVGARGIPIRGLRWLTRRKYRFHDVLLSSTVERAYHALAIDERRAPFLPALWAAPAEPGQVIEQVWFCGVHSDIGGGYAKGEWGLSDLALAWMRDKAAEAGLAIDAHADAAFAPQGDARGLLHNSRTGAYLASPPVNRVIGRPASGTAQPTENDTALDPTQSLHPSVRARWDADPRYRPANLRRYFELIADPRASALDPQPV
jgi:uncharacterized protein (DUF2235 family)